MRWIQKRGWIILLAALLLLLGAQAGLAENTATVSGLVWVEKTINGIYDSGEGSYGVGARVTLEKRYPEDPSKMYINRTSDQSGSFVFSGLAAGEYRMRVEVTPEYRFTIHGSGSAALPAQGSVSYSPFFTLAAGQTLTMNVGLTKNYCTVSLLAFVDENGNGGRLAAEPVVRGVQAELLYEYEGESYVVAIGTTNQQGELFLRDLSPSTYRMRVTLPDNLVIGPIGQKINTFYNCFLPNADNTGITEPFTLDAKEGVAMGVGLVRTGSLTGKVWYDANYNGQWDADEGGLTQAVVTLYSPALGLTRTAAPNDRGEYAFRALQPGDYQLGIQLPQGMIFTYPGASMISEIANQASLNVTVQVDVTTNLGSVGAMPSAGLNLLLYQDDNLNGRQDEGEPGLSGAQVAAAQGGKQLETVITGGDGKADFQTLRGGETTLSVSLPAGYVFGADQSGLFSSVSAQNGAEAVIFLDGSQQDTLYTAAVTVPASVSGAVFEDVGNTGVYAAGGSMLPGVTVQAVDQNGAIAAQTVTGPDGAYSLAPLMPGSYAVRFLLADDYVASNLPEESGALTSGILFQTPEYGQTDTLYLAPGQQAANVNAGMFRAGKVDGYVLIDQAYAEDGRGLAGVNVVLMNENGQPASAYSYGVTDETGYFFIKGVLPGVYTLNYILPDNGQFTQPQTNAKQWATNSFVSESGSDIRMPEVRGMYTSTLSGRMIYDELGIDPSFNPVLSLVGQNTRMAYQIHIQPDGSYAFTGLKPDTYILQVMLPENLVFGQLEGSPIQAAASNVATATITFEMGDAYTDADILASLPVNVSGTVYYDDNMNGQMDGEEYGAEGRALTLWRDGAEIASVYTNEEGYFVFDRLIPADYELHIDMDENEVLVDVAGAQQQEEGWMLPIYARADSAMTLPLMRYASVSGNVWSMDGSFTGVDGLAVALLNENGNIIASVMTDEFGAYSFPRLLPGTYTLTTTLPSGYLFARAQDTEKRESFIQGDPDGKPRPIAFAVPMGDDLSGMDIGMGAMGSIGDRAWLDENGNGMQDIDEPYMPGIKIALYQHGQLIAETTTNEYGKYLITDVYPGDYEMRVTMHSELKATVHQTEFPLVSSVLPESKDTTVTVPRVVVPSGSSNLHCDLGFQLRKKGVYPAAMDEIPTKDWRPYSER